MGLRWTEGFAEKVIDESFGRAIYRSANVLEIYDGSRPTNVGDSTSANLLASIDIPEPGFSDVSVSSGPPLEMTKTGTWQDTVDQDGTAAWFRVETGAGPILDGTISGTGGGGDLELNDVNLVSGGTITINTFTIRMPLANGTVEISDALAARLLQRPGRMSQMFSPGGEEPFDRFAIFDGSVPDSANASTGATKLAEIDINDSSPESEWDGPDQTDDPTYEKRSDKEWEATIDADGTAAFFRIYRSVEGDDGVSDVGNTLDRERLQGDITETGGGGVLELDSVSFVSGGSLSITSFSISYPHDS